MITELYRNLKLLILHMQFPEILPCESNLKHKTFRSYPTAGAALKKGQFLNIGKNV